MNRLSLGLIGKDIGHSRSQEIYEEILDKSIDYHLFDFKNKEEIPHLENFFLKIDGLSITSPYKGYFFSFVEPDHIAKRILAVNCIKKCRGRYLGTMTDYYGIRDIFGILEKKYQIRRVILLGDGIMSKTSALLLQEKKIPFKMFSRRKTQGFNALNFKYLSEKGTVIINACSRDYAYNGGIHPDSIFWDYNYNFEQHKYLKDILGERYVDGVSLLYTQAKYALSFWKDA